jgi:hypothetical protein
MKSNNYKIDCNMPGNGEDYSKNLNYKIVCKDLTITESYAGSSTNWTRRTGKHQYDCHNENSSKYHLKVYAFIRAHGGWENWDMVLIEIYPCKNYLEASQRERYWVETLKTTLNCNIPGRTCMEWIKDNKEHIAVYQAEYRAKNKEKLAKQQEIYYQNKKLERSRK